MIGIKIERGVPIPKQTRDSKYPFAYMDIGDSFFVPGAKAASLQNAAKHHSKRTGHAYSSRTVTENGVDGARIWRIEPKDKGDEGDDE
jgi:hypothetical protein